jgi:hypothetical protein
VFDGLKKVVSNGLLVALAVGVGAFSRSLALRPDPGVERLLDGPSPVERAMDSLRHRSERMAPNKSPLVAQAEAFALYLDPPAPPQPKPRPARTRAVRPQPKPVASAPKFRLVGISYYRTRPAESKALLWGPGDGYVWVRQGAQFGHLTIEEIKGRSLVCREAGRIQEIALDAEATPAIMPVQNVPERAPPPPVEMEVAAPSLAKAERPRPAGEDDAGPGTTSLGRPRPRRAAQRSR